jgi:hypothetical protein
MISAHWTAENYGISYTNTLDVENTNPATYTIENAVYLTPLSKTGYEFLGWTYTGYNVPNMNAMIAK